MRHWRAAGDMEFFHAETEKGFSDLKDLDDLTGWSGNLHQSRFSFIEEKYAAILDEYLERYGR
ncbi:hypothetical protein JCM19037_4143 [Geomicrobium sp. JCM 19037]|uniref:DUF1140 family protein n=1 Tax=Geomicrobium sp. JCM 19037 TaxID=1460634 RepID=UPI00045F332D|nr:DUF1140 family protein [Geomicrobium sp. JCM 19037]GAK05630.1 hypothetical protein JCM19037_4143 [Geomicrobium sp. JCM 19037]